MIPLVNFTEQIKKQKKNIFKNISKVITHKKFIMGPEVFQIEKKLKTFVNTKFCATVSSGSDALLISLMAIGLKKNDEVIIPGFTYIAPAEAIVRLGGKPVLVDVNIEDANINVSLIKKKITKKTKAIIFVNLFGNMCDVHALIRLKKKYKKIIFIEDAAQSFGSKIMHYKSCNTLDISCTSFFPAKAFGCYGDGGAIFTKNRNLHKKIISIREHGQKKKYHHDIIGIGGRFDTIQAAILIEKIKFFKKEILYRKIKFNYYLKLIKHINIFLSNSSKLKIIKSKKSISCYSSFNVMLPINSRDGLIDYLKNKKISTAIYYPRTVSDNNPYKKFCCNKCLKNSNILKRNIIALPFDPYIKKKDIKYVCTQIYNFYKQKAY